MPLLDCTPSISLWDSIVFPQSPSALLFVPLSLLLAPALVFSALWLSERSRPRVAKVLPHPLVNLLAARLWPMVLLGLLAPLTFATEEWFILLTLLVAVGLLALCLGLELFANGAEAARSAPPAGRWARCPSYAFGWRCRC